MQDRMGYSLFSFCLLFMLFCGADGGAEGAGDSTGDGAPDGGAKDRAATGIARRLIGSHVLQWPP